MGRLNRGWENARRVRTAASEAEHVVAQQDASVVNLLRWAESDSLRLSDKVTVGAATPGGPRGLIAARDVERGEEVISLPTTCTGDAQSMGARGGGNGGGERGGSKHAASRVSSASASPRAPK